MMYDAISFYNQIHLISFRVPCPESDVIFKELNFGLLLLFLCFSFHFQFPSFIRFSLVFYYNLPDEYA